MRNEIRTSRTIPQTGSANSTRLQGQMLKVSPVISHFHFLWQVFYSVDQDTGTPTPLYLQVWELHVSYAESTRQMMSWQSWVTPQALLNLSQKNSISFYLDQAYQCTQLWFDSILMIQAPKNLRSSPTKKQNPKSHQASATLMISSFPQIQFPCNTSVLLFELPVALEWLGITTALPEASLHKALGF